MKDKIIKFVTIAKIIILNYIDFYLKILLTFEIFITSIQLIIIILTSSKVFLYFVRIIQVIPVNYIK